MQRSLSCFKLFIRSRLFQGNRKLLIIVCVITVHRYSDNNAHQCQNHWKKSEIAALSLNKQQRNEIIVTINT